VDTSSLPVGDQSDGITITSLNGSIYANTLATKILQRYVDPAATVSFSIDLNEINNNGNLLKVSDTIQMTTDEAFDQGQDSWSVERLFVTSVITDFSKGIVKMKAVQSRAGYQAGKKYGFIAPNGQPDYPTATDAEKFYCYIGDNNNLVDSGTVDGYYVI
jgi:hypothetical protein